MKISYLLSFIALVFVTGVLFLKLTESSEIPPTNPDMFQALLSLDTIPDSWIEPVAEDELSPAALEQIAMRLKSQGGKYIASSKTIDGWELIFENGIASARIMRAKSGRLIGVSFSDVE